MYKKTLNNWLLIAVAAAVVTACVTSNAQDTCLAFAKKHGLANPICEGHPEVEPGMIVHATLSHTTSSGRQVVSLKCGFSRCWAN